MILVIFNVFSHSKQENEAVQHVKFSIQKGKTYNKTCFKAFHFLMLCCVYEILYARNFQKLTIRVIKSVRKLVR